MFLILSQNKISPNIVKLMLGAGGNIMGNVYGYFAAVHKGNTPFPKPYPQRNNSFKQKNS